MSFPRLISTLCLAAGLTSADTYQLILQGKVTLADGSAPPMTVGIERICSDETGSAPGPITNKKGEYLWRMEVDPMRTRVCKIRAHLVGYASTEIDISGFNSYSNPKLPPLVLTPSSGDPTVIKEPEGGVPAKAGPAWTKAMKAIDGGDLATATTQLQNAVTAVPKFATGWNALGLVYGTQSMAKESKDAFERAIAADPKILPPYVNLARICIKLHDWDCASKSVDGWAKADLKHQYSEMYLHQAVARFELKDLAGAESATEQARHSDQSRKGARAEYVLGRIQLAKGDLNGAREHLTKYLTLDPNAPDVEQIQAELKNLDKPDARPEPELELP